MEVPIYVVDSFTKHAFAGNPAGVCFLDSPIGDEWMQSVAAEMRHAETAFLQATNSGSYRLRWFTPTVEVNLCGHATLAAAHILWETGMLPVAETAVFETKSGTLTATRSSESILMDFPSEPAREKPCPPSLEAILGAKPLWYGENRFDMLVELEDANTVCMLLPNLSGIKELGHRGLIVTSRGESHDFISRFFAPASGVDEDPVTGSAHCCLGPFWAERIGRETLEGYQASPRGGVVRVIVKGDRTLVSGHAVTVLSGVLRC